MLSPKSLLSSNLRKGINQAIYHELYQSHLWNFISNRLQRVGLFGTQKYFLKEAAEELTHYTILVNFMNDMGDCADMPAIEAIKEKIENIEDALTIGYETEKDVYDFYKELYEQAEDEDCTVGQFLLQFIQIQREAVGSYADFLAKYKIAFETKEILEFDEYMSEQ